MATTKITRSVTINGREYRQQIEISGTGRVERDPTIAAAKAGTLAVRTDNDTGSITASSGGHGVTTGATLDVYWVNADGSTGRRYGMTVGTVAGTTIPIDLGAGDNLPLATTAVTFMVPTTVAFNVVGDNMDALGLTCDAPATAVILDVTPATIHVMRVDNRLDADSWDSQSGVTNPMAAETAVSARLSHGDATAAHTVALAAQVD